MPMMQRPRMIGQAKERSLVNQRTARKAPTTPTVRMGGFLIKTPVSRMPTVSTRKRYMVQDGLPLRATPPTIRSKTIHPIMRRRRFSEVS